MDYIFFSAIKDVKSDVFMTYDIACQYQITLRDRINRLPLQLRFNLDAQKIYSALPVWHGGVHILSCRSCNLVQYQRGAAKVDGEAPKRLWAQHNECSYATKEMGVGSRHDAIEDRLDHHNHKKNAEIGTRSQLFP